MFAFVTCVLQGEHACMHDGISDPNSLVLNPFDVQSWASWDTHMKRLLVATETKQQQVCIL